ncbi:MAG TPA: signal peptidase II [Opitutaceae bacterium]|jgi:signal peptidase II|nr:signal peptidase II [Opitutaceae bacterium]
MTPTQASVSRDTLKSIASPAEPASGLRRILAYRLLLLLAALVVVLDQATKAWIHAHLLFGTYGEPGAIPVVRGFFYLVHVGNTGAAWSIFAGRSAALAVLAAATLAAIFFWRRPLGLRQAGVQICFGLLCGGILGNLVDRLLYGHVIDFLDFHFGSYIYPTFNVADSAICIGVGLYVLHSLRTPHEG